MIKVLALDLDGTLLTKDQTIHPATKAAINEIKKYCQVMIVTGRHHITAMPFHVELGLDTPMICCNGTYLYDRINDKVLAENSLNKEDAQQFLQLATESNLKMLMYVDSTMHYSIAQKVNFIDTFQNWSTTLPLELRPKIVGVESFEPALQNAEYIWKFVVEGDVAVVKDFYEKGNIKDSFTFEQSWSDRFDFSAKGNNKGARLAQYIESIGLGSENVMAIGDNHNDISMLTYAKYGVAMDNAEAVIKECAKLATETDNNGDGIAQIINKMIKK